MQTCMVCNALLIAVFSALISALFGPFLVLSPVLFSALFSALSSAHLERGSVSDKEPGSHNGELRTHKKLRAHNRELIFQI